MRLFDELNCFFFCTYVHMVTCFILGTSSWLCGYLRAMASVCVHYEFGSYGVR